MNPFIRISHRVQEDHKIYGHYTGLAESILGADFKRHFAAVRRHRAECPICSHPRLYAFGRQLARWTQILRAHIPVLR